MHKPNPKFPYNLNRPLSTDTVMDSKQLIDSLTAHISLYHSSSHSLSTNTNPNPRSSILKWFSSLTVHQRQAHLTTVDPNFIQILLQMQGKHRSDGHGFFIILPDLPSGDRPCLPTLCFRRSHGLLARVSGSNESERMIFEAIRFFNSREGENVVDCSCNSNCLDSMTVCEEFVENVDRFVGVMDAVSNGGFLRGEESGLGSDWVELEWLKAKGYYSIEAFVANRLEVALRLSWLNSNNGKKRGVKLKEKAAAAGMTANAYWRKKGCIDWWRKLDVEMRRKVFTTVLGKAAKSLTIEILKGADNSLDDKMSLVSAGAEQPLKYNNTMLCQKTICTHTGKDVSIDLTSAPASVSGKPSSFVNAVNGLFVLLDILDLSLACQHSKYDQDNLFFSSLVSVSTISDCILRKLRGLLMIISLDCTKLELLDEGDLKVPPKMSKEKPCANGRRKKGKTRNMKRPNPVPRSSGDDDLPLYKLPKDCGSGLVHKDSEDVIGLNGIACTLQGKGLDRGTPLSAVDMEHDQGSIKGSIQNSKRKSRKKSNKSRYSGLNDPAEVGNFQKKVTEISTPREITSQVEATNPDWLSDKSIVQYAPNDISIGSEKDMLDTSPNNSTSGPIREDNLVQSSQEEYFDDSTECSHTDFKRCHSLDITIDYHSMSSRIGTVSSRMDYNGTTPALPSNEVDGFLVTEVIDCRAGLLSEIDKKSVFSDVLTNSVGPKEKISSTGKQENARNCDTGSISSSGCPSFEWPTVSSVRFPSVNSHLPAATDRLHLDVGHNWHNHFHRSFIQTVHQSRNPSIDNGGNRNLSRPLPMSLDWPPMVRSINGLASSVTCSYDSGFILRQPSFQQGFTAQSVQPRGMTNEDERMYSGDLTDLSDLQTSQELVDELDNHWISEEELEVHAVSGMDYNQYFGGGVMYWNPSDHHGTSFSRPPSLSSDDSSWAWHEADMNRAVDDMVAFSSSYSTNGLTSPSAASFVSPFDPLGPVHQALGYVIAGGEVNGKVLHTPSTVTDVAADENTSGSLSNLPVDGEVKAGDSFPYPVLPPIIIPNMSRERSRSDFRRSHDHKSPCVPPNRREQPRIKRPPSPVVLCVPRAPRPPPPSPVGDSRKHRGFPTVRSGSSSPRQWGVKGWFHDGTNFEEACVRMDGSEVVWPTWRNKSLSAHPMIQPLSGALLQDRLIAISQLTRDQEHPDVSLLLQPPDLLNCSARKASLSLLHSLLHEEIDSFCKQVAAENMIRKPYVNWAVKRVTRSLQVLWPRSRTHIYGSNATGLSLPTSDVDLVVSLPPVRNLEPIKEAGILEGRNGIKETCLQHAARYLANQEWVKNDSLKTVENTAIPIIMLVVEVPNDLIISATSNVHAIKEEPTQVTGELANLFQTDLVGLENSTPSKLSQMDNDNDKNVKSVRLDVSFKSPSHTGFQTTELVKELTEQFPAATPLALVLKQFLSDRSLDQSYSGGLSSYCLILLITRFLQHEHHLGRPINQNLGSLLMDFLYFFGNVFDPRQMRISVQGSGIYINRERGYSIDPIYIDDPLFPTNNVGRNCFRIHQCIKKWGGKKRIPFFVYTSDLATPKLMN
ncbi:uncharacterized protein LOC132299140 isoform X2 [Cornus florida]|uniref:uncharacterized protein LOC132299140 isoform X2 n=1 Tax=Cornus florida TaxID=4283 RepID=UPI0028999991|nr:uncharacterized protein LOC132299140 isoform X2 [Cornus florida]